MNRKLFGALLLVGFLTIGCVAVAHAGIDEAIAATCKITCPDRSCGTGTVFERKDGSVFILTAAHVVAKHPQVQCEFWQQGHQSLPIPATVRGSNPTIDAAWLSIPEETFAGRGPAVIPFAERGKTLPAGSPIASVGCANGSWATAWQGHVTGYDQDRRMHFLPPPADGRSGSAILTGDGSRIVGVLQSRMLDNSDGQATIADVLRAGLSMPTVSYDVWTPCGPGGCPGGSCGPMIEDRGKLFGRQQQPQMQLSPTPYPTLPPPAAPPTDLSPILGAINSLPGQIAAIIPQQAPCQPAIPIPQQPSGPDPQTQQQLQMLTVGQQQNAGDIQKVAGAVNQLQAEMPKQIDAAVGVAMKPLGEKIDKVGKQAEDTAANIAKHGTLLERLAAAKAEVVAKEPDAPRWKQDIDTLKETVKERFAKSDEQGGGDNTLRHVLIVLACVGLVAIAIVHTIRTGRGPVGAVADKIIERHPDNELAKKFAAFTDRIDGRLAGLGHLGSAAGNLAGAALPLAAMGLGPLGVPLAAAGTIAPVAADALHATVAGLQKAVDDVKSRVTSHDEQLTAVALATPAPQAGK